MIASTDLEKVEVLNTYYYNIFQEGLHKTTIPIFLVLIQCRECTANDGYHSDRR